MKRNRTVTLLILAVILVTTRAAIAAECGDHDGSGAVAASDALLVLKKAVGLDESPLQCPDQCVETTTTSTTTNTTPDQCFNDQDCENQFGPGLVCGGPSGVECVQCDANDADCDNDAVCVNYECVAK
ncbi:MAG TPA: hypothetical protein VEB21_17070 [Terriglobales bacterium]|nr:hypothetical protein [Terriglobales bacterium]